MYSKTHALPSGQIFDKDRVSISEQQGITCILYCLKRIGFLSLSDLSSKSAQALLEIEGILSSYNSSHIADTVKVTALINKAMELCQKHAIDYKQIIQDYKSFNYSYNAYLKSASSPLTKEEFFEQLHPLKQAALLYNILIKEVIMPLMRVSEADWNPKRENAISTLQESLNKRGPHMFVGKFGKPYYDSLPKRHQAASKIAKRDILYFDKDSYRDDSLTPHAILVDDMIKIGGKDAVIYRDSNDPSILNQPDLAYMMTYDNFVKRLTDMQGNNVMEYSKETDAVFCLVSNCIEKLYIKIIDVDKFLHLKMSCRKPTCKLIILYLYLIFSKIYR